MNLNSLIQKLVSQSSEHEKDIKRLKYLITFILGYIANDTNIKEVLVTLVGLVP